MARTLVFSKSRWLQLLEWSGLVGEMHGQSGCRQRDGLDRGRGAAMLFRWEDPRLGKMGGKKGPHQVGYRAVGVGGRGVQ